MTDIVPAFLESTSSRVDQHKQISNNTSTEQIVMWYGTLKKKKGMEWFEKRVIRELCFRYRGQGRSP